MKTHMRCVTRCLRLARPNFGASSHMRCLHNPTVKIIHQKRSYAMPLPRMKPKRLVKRTLDTKKEDSGDSSVLRFDPGSVDLAGLTEFQQLKFAPFPQTPANVLRDTWVVFCNTVNGRSRHEAIHNLSLEAFPNLSAQQLHELGVTLQYMPRLPAANAANFPWAIMWAVAGRTDYEPAYLTLALFLAMPDQGKGIHRMPWLQTRFEKSIANNNPNAMAIKARFAFTQGHVREAIAVIEKLLNDDDPAFEIRDLSASWLARCYIALGRKYDAARVMAGYNLIPDVQQQAAQFLLEEGKSREARERFYISRDRSKYQKLNAIEMKWMDEAGTEDLRKEYWRWAAEWNAMETTMDSYIRKHSDPAD